MTANWLALVLPLITGSSPATAVDLIRVSGTIAREPVYRSKAPRYCLLVFGFEARSRVWLILDGDTLYVDRNGNGDLTEEGERVRAAAPPGRGQFTAGDVREGPLVHTDLTVSQRPSDPETGAKGAAKVEESAYEVRVRLAVRARPAGGAWLTAGPLRFADRPDAARAIHFNGPLTMALLEEPILVAGQPGELRAAVGTPGLGQGTFAYLEYEGVIPKGVGPLAEIEFPPTAPGGRPVRAAFPLTDRC